MKKIGKRKNFTGKSYICNLIKEKGAVLLPVLLVMLLVAAGCQSAQPWEKTWDEDVISEGQWDTAVSEQRWAQLETEHDSVIKARARSMELALAYQELYQSGKQTTAQSRWGQSAISQKAVDEIEEFFIAEGYAVLNSDSKYPSYLENAQRFYDFWDAVCRGDDIELEVLSVAQSGGLYYSLFRNEAGAETRVDVSVDWDEEGEPFFSSVSYVEDEWTLTEYGNFYYKNVLTGVPYEDYELISLKPVDKTLYDLTEKYLAPIGYLSNNLLTCSWSREDYGTLSFNDLLEYLYRMEHNAFFSPEAYESVREPYSCYRIPAALFEETILPYFDINLAELRQRSLYDAVTDSYPWQEICCENLTYYPTVEPEVVHCRDNADGTLTLTVRAKCNDYKTDCLFVHEVVIRPLENGGYQYLRNTITEKGQWELPPNYPRLPPQRPEGSEIAAAAF